jgi:hypothetical protein
LLQNKVQLRLPTEEEWEYACRAGTTTEFFWGDKDEGAAGYVNDEGYKIEDALSGSGCEIVSDGWKKPTDVTAQLLAGELYSVLPTLKGPICTPYINVNPRAYSENDQTAGQCPAPVGLKKPNPWGLYDMQGNVAQFCCNLFYPYDAKQYPNVQEYVRTHPERCVMYRGLGTRQAKFGPRSAARSLPDFPTGTIGSDVVPFLLDPGGLWSDCAVRDIGIRPIVRPDGDAVQEVQIPPPSLPNPSVAGFTVAPSSTPGGKLPSTGAPSGRKGK